MSQKSWSTFVSPAWPLCILHRLRQVKHQPKANGPKCCIVICGRLCHSCNLFSEPQKKQHVNPSFPSSQALQHKFFQFSQWSSLAPDNSICTNHRSPKEGRIGAEEWWRRENWLQGGRTILSHSRETTANRSADTVYQRAEWMKPKSASSASMVRSNDFWYHAMQTQCGQILKIGGKAILSEKIYTSSKNK